MPAAKHRSFGILSLEIRDFRGIAEMNLSWEDATGQPNEVVVLAGPNGSGKTTVLEACLLALGHQDLLYGPQGVSAIRSGAQDYAIIVRVQTAHGKYRGAVTANGRHEWKNEDKGIESLPPALPPVWYYSSWRSPMLMGALSITAGKKGKRPKATEVNRLWRAKQYLVNAKAHSFMNSANTPSLYDEAIGTINSIWRDFYPGAKRTFLVDSVSEEPDEGFDVYLTGPGRERIPVDALSSGQLEIFTFFAALVEAREEPHLIVMDEPEMHLDPAWHTLFVRSMRRALPNTQFLLGTHSPELYDSVYSFQRRLLLPADDPRLKSWHRETQGAAP